MPQLTDLCIRSAVAPAGKRLTLWDASVKHFGVRVTDKGAKTFIVLLGSGRRHAIGKYPTITLAQARAKAKTVLAEQTLGRYHASTLPWQKAVAKFLDARLAEGTKDLTIDEYERILGRYFAFGTTKISQITKRNISERLEKLNRVPSQKAHALVVIKMFFRWALQEGYVETDPTASFKRSKQKRRTRLLSDAELKSVWHTCCDEGNELPQRYRTIVKLLILCGQRRGETAALRCGYFSHNQQTICLPPELTKNAREHTFPLGATATAIVSSSVSGLSATDLLFPAHGKPQKPFNGWSKSKAMLDECSGVTGWRLHDLRRTFRTIHGRIGTPPHIAERILNHINGVASEVEQTYDVWTYLPEMRAATAAYENALAAIFTDATLHRAA